MQREGRSGLEGTECALVLWLEDDLGRHWRNGQKEGQSPEGHTAHSGTAGATALLGPLAMASLPGAVGSVCLSPGTLPSPLLSPFPPPAHCTRVRALSLEISVSLSSAWQGRQGSTKTLCAVAPNSFWAREPAARRMGRRQRHHRLSTCNWNIHVQCKGQKGEEWPRLSLPVAMVSMGLPGRPVTRQQERDQDKGSWCEGEVWGRCECVG